MSHNFVNITVLFNRVFPGSFLLYLAALSQAVLKIHEEDLVAALVPPEPAVPLVGDHHVDRAAAGPEEVLPALSRPEDIVEDPFELFIARFGYVEDRPEVQPIDEGVSDEVDGQLLLGDQAE